MTLLDEKLYPVHSFIRRIRVQTVGGAELEEGGAGETGGV